MATINSVSKTVSIEGITTPLGKVSVESIEKSSSGSLELLKTKLTLSAQEKEVKPSTINSDVESYDPSLPVAIALLSKSDEEQFDVITKEMQEYDVDTKFSADAALTKLNKEMVSLQHKIEAVKPDILGKKWDFVLTDGKIEITNTNLKQADKQWLENTLNRNKTVVGAVKDFYASVVKHFEHTQDHPSSFDNVDGKMSFAYGVDEQINGKLELKSIMDQLIAKNSNAIGAVANPFIDSMEIARSYLKMSDQATYFHNKADMTDPTTAAYVNAHTGLRF